MKRSTEDLYDEEYFNDKYSSWIEKGLSMENPHIKQETEKKLNFIKRYMPDVKSVFVPGCSFGFLVMLLIENGYNAFGADISQYAIDRAPRKVKPYIQKMNIKKMNCTADSFELVACFDIVEHLYYEEILQAFKEINRVAKEFILIRTPVPYYDAEPWISDFSNHPSKHHAGHVSVYPWQFWVRRIVELGKFEFWFTSVWGRKEEHCCEAWITFVRRK